MGTLSILFGNPAVRKLEELLWETARKRYLGEHPLERTQDSRVLMRKVKTAYKDVVAAAVQEEDPKIRAAWAEFKKVMTEELKTALSTTLSMSSLDWYSIEAGQLPAPQALERRDEAGVGAAAVRRTGEIEREGRRVSAADCVELRGLPCRR